MRVGIVGVGPVGATLAVFLKEAGALVVPCDATPGRIDAIKNDGIRLTHTMQKHVPIRHACYSIQELSDYDLEAIVIAVKTPHLKKVIGQLREFAKPNLHMICAQNGIDNEVEVGREFGEHRTHRMVINYAGNMADDNTVHVNFFHAPNYIASLADAGNEMTRRFAGLLNAAGLATEIPPDIQDHVWRKAILNAALAAVCAITRRTTKDVMDFPATSELVEMLVDESMRVAESERIQLGERYRRFSLRYLKNTGYHRPSMLVDLANGDPTEVDQLNGRIVFYGHKHCLPTPLNQAVTAMIHMLESGAK